MSPIAGKLSVTTASLIAAIAAGACQAKEPGGLRLIYAEPFGIVFMEDAPLDRARPGAPVEVRTWSFFDEPERPGRGPGWNTRITLARVDCQTRTLSPLHHQVFQGDVLVNEVTPPFRMQPPNGPEKAAVLTWVCDPEEEPIEIVVDDLAAARDWADAAWPTMNPDHPARRDTP